MGKVEDRTGEAGDTWTAALMTTVALEAPGLGDRSYLISDGEVGVVVDPQRDPSQYLHEADQLGVDITFVLETTLQRLRQRGPGARASDRGHLAIPQANRCRSPTSSALSVTVTSSPPASWITAMATTATQLTTSPI